MTRKKCWRCWKMSIRMRRSSWKTKTRRIPESLFRTRRRGTQRHRRAIATTAACHQRRGLCWTRSIIKWTATRTRSWADIVHIQAWCQTSRRKAKASSSSISPTLKLGENKSRGRRKEFLRSSFSNWGPRKRSTCQLSGEDGFRRFRARRTWKT